MCGEQSAVCCKVSCVHIMRLMENVLIWYSSQLDDYDQPALSAKLKEYSAKFPGTNNDITEPAEFNLMFGTSIGPTGLLQG